jgi:hypothetical protein
MVELPNVLGLLNVLGKCGLGDVKPLRLSSDVQRPGYSMSTVDGDSPACSYYLGDGGLRF